MFEKWFPGNEEFNKKDFANGWAGFIRARRYIGYLKSFINSLVKGDDKEFFDVVDVIKPDLMIVVATHYDSFIWALLSYKAGVKTIYLHDTLCNSKQSGAAPVSSSVLPDHSALSWVRIKLAWWNLFFQDFFYSNILRIKLSKNYGVTVLCKHYGYPVNMVDKTTDMLAPKIKLIEVVLCPKEFDFPVYVNKVGRYYVGPSIDLNRNEEFFSWKIVGDNPLIYCALGTLEFLPMNQRVDFFRKIIEAAKYCEHWQWIIAVGNTVDIKRFNKIPAHVILVNVAPQLNILKRASFMICHGGPNTVKECILFGVPMIVFPLGFDQPGNAARVIYHGLGLRADVKKMTVDSLLGMLDEISNNSYFRVQMSLFQHQFRLTEKSNQAVDMIEVILNGGN